MGEFIEQGSGLENYEHLTRTDEVVKMVMQNSEFITNYYYSRVNKQNSKKQRS